MLSKNRNAVHLLKKNMNKVSLQYLCQNINAVDLLEKI